MTMDKDKCIAATIAGAVMGITSDLPALGNRCVLPTAVLAGLGAESLLIRAVQPILFNH